MRTIDATTQTNALAKTTYNYVDGLITNPFGLSVKYFPGRVDDVVKCAHMIAVFFAAGNKEIVNAMLVKSMYTNNQNIQIRYNDRVVTI